MNNTVKNKEIDLFKLARVLLRHALIIILVSVITAAAAFGYTKMFKIPPYRTTASIYIDYPSKYGTFGEWEFQSNEQSVPTTDTRVNTYIQILKSRTTLEEVVARANLPYSADALSGMISAEAAKNTTVLSITVTNQDAQMAERIANTLVEVLPERINEVIGEGSVSVVDYAVTPAGRAASSANKNAAMGFVVGAFITIGLFTVKFLIDEMGDNAVHSVDELKSLCNDIPVLALIPDMNKAGKKDRYYSAYYGNGETADGNMNFAAKEAFKRLRTNTVRKISDGEGCKVIGITSAQPAEGKTTVAVNLARSLAELGEKVLLLDADMRRPAIHEQSGIMRSPGLSNVLQSACSVSDAIKKLETERSGMSFDIITAGDATDIQTELISSKAMGAMLSELSENYKYIVIDLPSVGAVADAVAAVDKTDGMIVVLKENCCSADALADCVGQLQDADANILGFVMNYAEGTGKK